jgi:autotransporter-associated beta strand protein
MKKAFTPKKTIKLLSGVLFVILFTSATIAAPIPVTTAIQSGNWSSTSTWSTGVVPIAGTRVEIGGTYTVTVDVEAACTALTLGDGVANGTLACNSNTTLTISSGLTIGNGATTGNITMASNDTIIASSITVIAAGTWTPGSGTIGITGTTTLPTTFFTSFYNLYINASTFTVQQSVGLSITNSLNITTGSILDLNGFNIAAGDLMGAGNITTSSTLDTIKDGSDNNNSTFSGVIDDGSATTTLVKNGTGALTLSGANTYSGNTVLNNGTLNINNSSAIGSGSFVINGGTIDNTTGLLTLSTNNTQTWNGSFSFNGTGSLNMGTGAITLSKDITVSVNGSSPIVEAGIINDNVNSLTINGIGVFDLSGQAIQLNSLFVLAGTFNTNNSNISLKGEFNNGGAFNPGTGSVIFNGTSNQLLEGGTSTSFYNLTLNNSAGLTLEQSETVTNALTLTSGQVTLGINNLTIGSSGSISGASSNKYIITNSTGTLDKVYGGAGTFNFAVGDNAAATDYTPISLNITTGTFPATVTVLTTDTKDPNNKSSVNYLNRYWKVGQTGLGTFSSAFTGTYLASDVAGTEASIATGVYTTSPWAKFSAVNTGTHQVSATVSALGDISGITLAAPTVSITPVVVCSSSPAISAIATGDDPVVTYSWNTGETASSINATSSGSYSVTAIDGNGQTAIYTTSVTVNQPSINLSSGAGTDGQSLCYNTALTDITYAIGGGATGASVSTLPAGLNSSFIGGSLTISGTPTAAGVYTYTVTTSGGSCGPQTTASGSITVNAPTVILASAVGTDGQSVCTGTAITTIKYIIGGSATSATFSTSQTGILLSTNADTVILSGTPTTSGSFPYVLSTKGGLCGSVTAKGNITVDAPSISLSSAIGTDAQAVCNNVLINDITYNIGGTATGATVTGLPPGMSNSYSSGTFTINGTPTGSGLYTYTVTTTGGTCGTTTATGTVTIEAPLVTLVSAVGTDAQTSCQNAPITDIKYAIGGSASGTTVSGLPKGVNGVVNNDTLTISGIPIDSGLFSYTVFTTGGACGTTNVNGTININTPIINLSSAVGTDVQAICSNVAIADITYTVGGNATGATATGLPPGVITSFSSGIFTISGTPTAGGVYNYTVSTTSSLCGPVSASGTITVNAPTVKLISASSTDAQSVCKSTLLTHIIYVVGGTATGVTVTGLPSGVTSAFNNDTLVISGTPADSGLFAYTVSTSGGSCGTTVASGTIDVMSPSITLSSAVNSDNQSLCGNSDIVNITYTIGGSATGAKVIGLPTGVNTSFSGNTITISGKPTTTGTFSYTLITTGGLCDSAMANGNITINPSPTVTIAGSSGLRAGTNDTLKASGAASYMWANGNTNGTNIVTPNTDSTFTVIGTSTNGCTDTASFVVIINVIGVNNISNTSSTLVYPNPATSLLNLSFNMQGAERNALVKIIDITGKEVITTSTSISNTKVTSIDISSLAQGMYFVKVITNNTIDVVKFIKQ